MGLFNKIKAGVKNVDSKLGEGVDVIGLKGKISDEKKKIEKLYRDIGELCYIHKGDLNGKDKSEFEDMCEKVDNSLLAISGYEKELKETKTKGHEERETNWKSS